MATKEEVLKYKSDCKDRLLSVFKEGITVYTILRKKSTSGMTRDISVVSVRGGEIVDLTHLVGVLLGYNLVGEGAISLRIRGCGMDMGRKIVDDISHCLHGMKLNHRWL